INYMYNDSMILAIKKKICEDLKNENADVNDIVDQATNIINKTKNNNKSWVDTYFLPEDQSKPLELKKYLLMQVFSPNAFFMSKIDNNSDIPEEYKLSNHYEDAFNLLLELSDFIDDKDAKGLIEQQLQNYKDGKYFGLLSDTLNNKVIELIISKLIQKDILPENMKFGNEISEEQAEKIIMALPSFDNLVEKRKMSLEQILNADDLFDFVGEDKLKDLEKVFDIWISPTLNADKMDKLGDLLLQRKDVLNNFGNAKKTLEFYYKHLPNLINKQIGTNTSNLYAKPVLSFAYKLLQHYDKNIKNGTIKDGNNSFVELQKCVAECTKDIWRNAGVNMNNISEFVNMYETGNTPDFDSLQDIDEDLNKMIHFFSKNKIITDDISNIHVDKLSNINVSGFAKFLEAVKFFFSHPILFFQKNNKAEHRVKLKNIIDPAKNIRAKVNLNSFSNQNQVGIFDLLKDASKTAKKNNDKQKLDLQ
ncbi:MAG: hypothetical protein IJU86_01315, partial [Firmicutes bacterium]|nr:hypothetical protein [Bacillota bacterium]